MHRSSRGKGRPDASVRDGEDAGVGRLIGLLQQRRDVFVATFLERVMAISDYGAGVVPPDDLRETAEETFAVLLRRLGAVDAQEQTDSRTQLREFATQLATRRARQGLAVQSLLSAIRMDLNVLWEHLREVAGPDNVAELVELADRSLSVGDEYASQIYIAYLHEREIAAQYAQAAQQELIATLFGGVSLSLDECGRIARVLEVDPLETLSLAAAVGSDASALRESVTELQQAGARIYLHHIGASALVFYPKSSALARARIEELRCGLVDQVDGLRRLYQRAHEAILLAELLTDADGGPLRVGDAWQRVSRQALLRMGLDVSGDIESRLDRARPGEAERLRATVNSYLRSGSISRTAQECSYHRNTVLNHLRRFHQLTDLDATVPDQAAMLVVAWSGR